MTRTTHMLPSVLALFAILVMSAPVEAQRGGGRGGRGGPGAAIQLPQLIAAALEHHEDVGLDAAALKGLQELKPDVDEAFEPFAERLQTGRQGGDREAMRALFQEAGEAMAPFIQRFNALVNEDQRASLRQYMPQRGRRGGGR